MTRSRSTSFSRAAICALALSPILSGSAAAQWPCLYFRPDPFLRMDLSRPTGGTSFDLSAYRYTAGSYFNGLDQTPHTSKADFPAIRFEREEFVFSGVVGLSDRTAAIVALPISHVTQRLFETGEWGLAKAWLGLARALDREHHLTLAAALAIPIDDPVGDLHYRVESENDGGYFTAQMVMSNRPRVRALRYYLRGGAGVYFEKDRWFGRRLYEIPGELRMTYRAMDYLDVGAGGDGRFVVGHRSKEIILFADDLTSHDAFAFGPDVIVRLTPETHLHAAYRHELFGFFATAGSYWNVNVGYAFEP